MGVYQSKYTGQEIDGLLGNNYSTDEQKIGTWVDGKPLYQKMVIIKGSQIGSIQAVDNKYLHNIKNVDHIWISDGYLRIEANDANYILASPHRIFWCDKTYVAVKPTSATDYKNYDLYFILRYTKTTD